MRRSDFIAGLLGSVAGWLCGAALGFPIGGSSTVAPPADLLTTTLAGMTAGTWKDLGTVAGVTAPSPSSVTPSPTPPGATGPTAVVNAWASGALDTVNEQFIITGGGHTDYGGNELYAFKLSTLNWSIIKGPTPNAQISPGSDPYGDGEPAARHTYNGVVFDAGRAALFVFCGIPYNSTGNGTNRSWKFNVNTGAWTQLADNQFFGFGPTSSGYDATSGKYYVTDNLKNNLCTYDAGTDTWTEVGQNSPALDNAQTTVFCPLDGKVYCFGNAKAYTLAPTSSSSTTTDISGSITGNLNCQNYASPGLVWHPGTSKFVGFVPGDANLYIFDTVAKTWTQHAPNGANAFTPLSESGGHGVFGRFVYDASHSCFLALTRYIDHVYCYKPNF
jgi:hypothetical protein